MFKFAPLIVVSNSEQTGPLQEVVPIGTIVLVLRPQFFHLSLEQCSSLLSVNQRLAVIAFLILNSTKIQFVKWILVRNLLEIKLRFIDLT
jgi:hypothetical protein